VTVERFAKSIKITASAGESGLKDFYVVEAGRVLTLKTLRLAFQSGTAGKMDIAIYRGVHKVHPTEGYLVGDAEPFEDELDILFFSEETIRIYYNNRDTVERFAIVKLEGIFE